MARWRRGWSFLLGLVGAGLVSGAALHAVSNARCFALVGESICRVDTDRPLIALTLDDGPTHRGVDATLPVLEARGARATFFLIGREAEQRPELILRIARAGHEIGNHSYSHRWMIGRGQGFLGSEIDRAHRVLTQAGAPPPRLFRPPYGKKLWGLPAALRERGYRMIMIDVEEPADDDPRTYAARLVREAKPGSILLMHLMYGANHVAREALPLVVEGLQARGFKVVTVSELLAAGEAQGAMASPSPLRPAGRRPSTVPVSTSTSATRSIPVSAT